jgi:hypothetical protein
MKYRRLRPEELAELEESFIRFLAVQGISGPDWEKTLQERPEEAGERIDAFSDVVFEKVIANVRYLELKRTKYLQCFVFDPDKVSMIGLVVEGETTLDLTQADLAPERMMELLRGSDAKLQLVSGERAYRESKEREIFELMENGALISKEGGLYHLLLSLRQD